MRAPRETVYRLLIDPGAVSAWMVPDGMTSHVHGFEPWAGGAFRVSLTYQAPTAAGKTSAHTDTYHGRFVELVPGRRVVQAVQFETDAPDMRGWMTLTISLTDSDGGTEVEALHEGLPPGVPLVDNETGTRMALDKLAALAEALAATETPERGGHR